MLEQAALHAPDPLVFVEQGQLAWISPAVEGALGWSPEEVRSQQLADLCHEEDQGALAALVILAAAGGAHRGVIRMKARDGRFLRMLVTLAPGNGHGSGALAGTVREIDQRVASEQRSHELLQWHTELSRRSGEVLLQVDDSAHVTWVSPAVTELLGWTQQEIIGRGPAELAHPKDVALLMQAWGPAGTDESSAPISFRCASKDGSWKWVQEQGLPLPAHEASRPIRMSRLRDITDLVAVQDQVEVEIAHHRSVIDSIIDPFVVLEAIRDSSGSIVDFAFADANAAACAFNRTSYDQLIGSRLLGRHPAAGLTELLGSYVATVEEGTPFIRNSWSYPQDLLLGEIRKYDVRAVKFGDGIAQTWRDATQRVEEADRLAQSEARLRAVIDAVVDPQLICLPVKSQDGIIQDFIIEDANEEVCAISGTKLDEIAGNGLRALFPELTRADLFDEYARVATSGVPALLDDITARDPRTGLERTLDIRCTQIQGSQVNLTWRDQTDRQRDRKLLAESEAQLRAIMEAAPGGMARLSLSGRFEEVNPALCRMLMHEPEWLKRHSIHDVLHPEDAPTHHRMRAEVAKGDQPSVTWEERLVRADGHTIWALQSLAAIRSDSGAIVSYVSQLEDVTATHQARERVNASERLYRLLAENASDVVVHLREGLISWVSPSVSAVLGGSQSDWIGRRLRESVHPFDLRIYDELLDKANLGDPLIRRARICAHDGAYHWIEAHVAPFIDESGRADGVSASMRNVDVEVQALAELDRQARVDTLTGLVTRREAMHRIEESELRREPGGGLALLFCDIDHFKAINDEFGHGVGDLVLRALANRMTEAVRLDDVVARMGGDELLVLVGGVHDITEATEVAEKLRHVAMQPIRVNGDEVWTSLSIGVTLARPGEPADALIARADAAMYQAKAAGRNSVVATTGDVEA